MKALALLRDLRLYGVMLELEGTNRLRCRARKGTLTPSLRDRIKAHRKELVRLLQGPPPDSRTVRSTASVRPLSAACDQCGGTSRTAHVFWAKSPSTPRTLCDACWNAGKNWFTVQPPHGGNRPGAGWIALCDHCGHELERKDFQAAPDECPGCGVAQ